MTAIPPAESEVGSATYLSADRLFARHLTQIQGRTDRVFGYLLILQWLAMIVLAATVSPLTWAGAEHALHPHLIAAVVLGAAIVSLPLMLIALRPGAVLTRHAIAVAQMLSSALLIDITGGRIETHFHVFGSLAFLAFYRDVRVLITASVVVALDHWVRGVWFPLSVYGVADPGGLRWLEHVGWVVFEDVFLVLFLRQSLAELRSVSLHRAQQDAHQRRLQEAIADAEDAREALRRQADELVHANAELQQFAYVASHDLKEPLRMIAQYLALIDRRLRPQLDSRLGECLDFAMGGATRMQRLIDDLLLYTRTSNPQERFERVDLGALLGQLRVALAARIEETGAQVDVAPLPTVRGSESLLGLLFQNLLLNALKFHGGGRPRIRVGCEAAGERWRISVSDDGIGIDPAQHERIFEVFQRLHSQIEYPGTGIGLAICRKVAQQHGGVIEVRSEPGKGATFTVVLPRAREIEENGEGAGGRRVEAAAAGG